MIPKDIILKIVEAGTWAPSGDNCQPWRFIWDGQKLLLLNVPERDTSLYNSRQRASLIAHGAVLENMDIAARSHGYSMCPTLFPEGEGNPLVAAIEFQECPREDDPLLPFITKRVTNRNPYKKRKTNRYKTRPGFSSYDRHYVSHTAPLSRQRTGFFRSPQEVP